MSNVTEKLIQTLDELKTASYTTEVEARQTNAKASRALHLIFQIGIQSIKSTEEEQKTLGPLIANALKSIQISIERDICIYRTRLESSVLQNRSALQFLMDDYGNLPIGSGETLSSKFESVNLKKTVEILEKMIHIWKDKSDSDEPNSDHETNGIPESHLWWSS